MAKKVFGFDLGKTSIGFCVRNDFDINEVDSVIIEKDHAEAISNKDRRRVYKTLKSHKSREKFFNKLWQGVGLSILEKDDTRFKKEFSSKKEKTIYNSALLRIALLQEKPLEEWQIYKAIYNAIQRRGYDSSLPWANSNKKSKEDEESEKLTKAYTQENNLELIKNEEYKYPCYYDAIRLGLWNEENPSELKLYVSHENKNKVRKNGLVTPRYLVEKELQQLWKNAQKQLQILNKISTEYFLYGEYEEAYGSYKNPEFKRFRGTETDLQGVLGQKIPRFDNRVIMKCKLMPKRNVCKANTIENVSFTLLMKLKNLRFTDTMGEKVRLHPEGIKQIYGNWLIKAKVGGKDCKLDATIIKTEIEKVIGKNLIKDKIEPMKANISGRSSFCRRACAIMNKFILSGELYSDKLDFSEFIDKETSPNPITEKEIRKMLSKVGDGNCLFIPDNRDEMVEKASDERVKTDILIGNLTNPIVRNRLQIFRDLLLKLKAKYKEPDEVIFEFIRDGADNSLFGSIKANNALKAMKDNEKENEELVKELKEANALYGRNFDKLKLSKKQGLKCVYSGRTIGINDFDNCEIDHVYPRTMGGNDALYNKVLCYAIENQKKAGRTPYEWLHNDEKVWFDYVERLESIKSSLGKRKYELLTSKPEDCSELIESYNGLAETAQIARLAQQITAFIFGWGLQVEGQNRRIFVNNGSSTAAIRRTYRLNKLLGDDVKKNRSNDKHHALDAICISFSRDYKYNKEKKVDEIAGLNPEIIKQAIETLVPYPYANNKPFKGNTKPLETVYGKRIKDGKAIITKRTELTSFEQKEKKIKTIMDEDIKNDLLNKLEYKMPNNEWSEMLKTYLHPKKKTLVKKVLTVESEGTLTKDNNGRERIGEYVDFGTKGVNGQFKHSKGHKGQILYYNEKGSIKVMPIYANIKTQEVKDKLEAMGYKLYNKGEVFHSGCLVKIPEEFKAGSNTYLAGIYKLRTITEAGQIKLETNNGIEVLTSAKNLTDAKFKKIQKEKLIT